MSLYSESELIKTAIKQVVSESIKEETSSCFRVYKSIVVKPPYFDSTIGNACQVRLIGDPSVLTLPYSSATQNVQSGDVVWVATTSNSFRNAIVWDTRYFQNDYLQKPKHYGVRWNKTVAQMTRMYDAADITTDTSNFGHFGATNPNYNNPFDSIYPWSEICLCNIDIDAYQNLAPGENIKNCVSAWEGEPGFSYTDPNGVWRYRPSFYGKSWEDDTYRYFDVSDSYTYSYIYYPESISGRWHGVSVTKKINGSSKTCLIPTTGIPSRRTGLNNHNFAKNYGATLDSIYSIDAEILLYIVEYATMNSQDAIGRGASNIYNYQNTNTFLEGTSNSKVVKISYNQSSNCFPNAIMEIGTYLGGTQIGTFYIVKTEIDPTDSNILLITLNEPVSVTTSNYWTVRGILNLADSEVGGKSGYIGENTKCNTYYRGMVLYGNAFFYVLGAYRNSDNHIWIAKSDAEADSYDALDTNVHIDTGIVMPDQGQYIKGLSNLTQPSPLSIPPFCSETGGNNSSPVGDYYYSATSTSTTILYWGGYGDGSYYNGVFSSRWRVNASESAWNMSARPRLKNP